MVAEAINQKPFPDYNSNSNSNRNRNRNRNKHYNTAASSVKSLFAPHINTRSNFGMNLNSEDVVIYRLVFGNEFHVIKYDSKLGNIDIIGLVLVYLFVD